MSVVFDFVGLELSQVGLFVLEVNIVKFPLVQSVGANALTVVFFSVEQAAN